MTLEDDGLVSVVVIDEVEGGEGGLFLNLNSEVDQSGRFHQGEGRHDGDEEKDRGMR